MYYGHPHAPVNDIPKNHDWLNVTRSLLLAVLDPKKPTPAVPAMLSVLASTRHYCKTAGLLRSRENVSSTHRPQGAGTCACTALIRLTED